MQFQQSKENLRMWLIQFLMVIWSEFRMRQYRDDGRGRTLGNLPELH